MTLAPDLGLQARLNSHGRRAEKKILLIQEILAASYPFPTLEKLQNKMKIRKMFIFSYRVVSLLGLLLLPLLAPAP
jgi:hypothetical protein